MKKALALAGLAIVPAVGAGGETPPAPMKAGQVVRGPAPRDQVD